MSPLVPTMNCLATIKLKSLSTRRTLCMRLRPAVFSLTVATEMILHISSDCDGTVKLDDDTTACSMLRLSTGKASNE